MTHVKRVRRILMIIAVVALAAIALGGAGRAFQQSTTQRGSVQIIDSYTVTPGGLRVTVSGTGVIQPERQLPLLTELPGIVEAVLVEVGDVVSQGDLLARVDASELIAALQSAQIAAELQRIAFEALTAPAREVDVAAAQAAVNAARAAVNAVYSAVTPQQAEIARLQAELARNQLWQAQLQRDLQVDAAAAAANRPGFNIGSLLPPDVIDNVPPDVIDRINQGVGGLLPSFPAPSVNTQALESGLAQAEYGVQIAEANAAGAAGRGVDQGSLASANAGLVQAQAALDRLLNGASELDVQLAGLSLRQAELAVQTAQANARRAELVAPFDGVVAQVNLRAGELPPNNQAGILLVDASGYFVDLSIDETDIVRVSEGQPVELRLDALPGETITGVVTRTAVAPIVAGQLVTYPVRVRLDAADAPIRIGMSATATIVVDELEEALVVPNRFIRIDRVTQQAYVTIEREPGRFVEIPVTLGLRNETETEIVSGLEIGQTVVLLPRGTFSLFGG